MTFHRLLQIVISTVFLIEMLLPLKASAEDLPSNPKIVLAGDSTVTDNAGWGIGFSESLTNGAICVNLAAGGRSSKSFRDEGRWKKVLEEKPDVILIQFGHNDQPGKGPERETDPKTTFRENLARYVDEARAIGAKPVLITSMTRRHWNKEGKAIVPSLSQYAEATAAVAKEKDVPLIDLHALSTVKFEELGPTACEKLSPPPKDGIQDRTHLNQEGSRVIGPMVAHELTKVMPEMASYVK